MVDVIFKNLERSDLIVETIREKIVPLVEKFPDLAGSNMKVRVEMLNSPLNPGPDLFSVQLRIQNGRYSGVIVKKEEETLYLALFILTEHMLEKLNRFGDRVRVKNRTSERAQRKSTPEAA